MANADVRKGLIPIRLRDGSPCNMAGQPYFVPASYGTALFIGDPVVKTGTSNTSNAGISKQFPAGTLPEINKATAGTANAVTGVIVGFEQPDNEGGLGAIYNPASTARVVYVNDEPDLVCEIQADSANAVAATDIGLNANLIYTHAGDTLTGLSGAELNTTGMTTTATLQLKVLRLVNRLDNELGTNAKLEVLINNHTEGNSTAGI